MEKAQKPSNSEFYFRVRLNCDEAQHYHDLDLVGQPKMDEQGLNEYVYIDHNRHVSALVQP
jgi:hypothetical protein